MSLPIYMTFKSTTIWATTIQSVRLSALWALSLVIVTLPRANAQSPEAGQASTDASQSKVFSGPQVGEEIRPFNVLHFKGDAVKTLEFKPPEKGSSMICFVHRLSNDDRILFGLGLVDFYARQHKDLNCHIVLLAKDREKVAKLLRAWTGGDLFTKSYVSLSTDGEEGPGYYGLNRNVAMTVVIAKGNKVVQNLVFNAPNAYDLEAIMQSVAQALGQTKPTLASVQEALKADRQRQLLERMKRSAVFKMAPNQELGRCIYMLSNPRGNRSKHAQLWREKMSEWAGNDVKRTQELQDFCKKMLASDIQFTTFARNALKQLSKSD